MALGRWCERCNTSWSVRKHPRLRRCPKCQEPFQDVWRIDVFYRGRRVVRLFHGALGEARQFEAEIKKRLRLGEPLPGEEEGPCPPLKVFVEKEYLPWLKENRPASYPSEVSFWRRHILPLLGEKPLDSIFTLDIERLKKTIREKGLGPRSQEKGLQFLRKALNLAHRWGKLPRSWVNPVSGVSKPKYDNRRKRAITPEEWAKLAPILKKKNPTVYGVSLFSLLLGLRRSEVLSLRWEDIDLERALVRLPREKDPAGRILPLPKILVDYLRTLLRGKPEEEIFKVHRDTVSKTFAAAVNEAGLNEGVSDPRNRLVFHCLRHGFATALATMNVSTSRAARLTRHKDLAMFRRYEHLSPEDLRQDIEAVARLFETTTNGATDFRREDPSGDQVKSGDFK